MYRGSNRILMLVVLFFVSVVCVLFFQRSTDWWKHPDFQGNIKAIAIYDGQFRGAADKPVATLNQTSTEAGMIVEALAGARLYRKWAKFESFANVDITYDDGKVDHVLIGSDFIELFPHGSDKSKYYKIGRKNTDSIRNIIEMLSRGAEGGGGSEEGNP